MEALRDLFTGLGFSGVETFIASGNGGNRGSVTLKPGYAEAHYNLGLALHEARSGWSLRERGA